MGVLRLEWRKFVRSFSTKRSSVRGLQAVGHGHIHAVDPPPVLQQAIESARGDPAIEADPLLEGQRKGLNGRQQLFTAPGTKRWGLHLELQLRQDLKTGLVEDPITTGPCRRGSAAAPAGRRRQAPAPATASPSVAFDPSDSGPAPLIVPHARLIRLKAKRNKNRC